VTADFSAAEEPNAIPVKTASKNIFPRFLEVDLRRMGYPSCMTVIEKKSLHSEALQREPSQALFTFFKTGPEPEKYVAGVDEAGRGPLAGPVVAAAVILNPTRPIEGIGDSKALTERQRDGLAVLIREHSLAWSVAWADAAEIDVLNILQATFLAMRRALCGLRVSPSHVQIDGNRAPSLVGLGMRCHVETIVKGDASVASIGAASILAKTVRDAMMVRLDEIYPGYGHASHKGYPTPAHYAALERLGPSPIHRMSFEPVRKCVTRDS
jgi:ribonuclease HII